MATPSHPASILAIGPPAIAAFNSPNPAIDRFNPFGMMPRWISINASAPQSRQSGAKKLKKATASVSASMSALEYTKVLDPKNPGSEMLVARMPNVVLILIV
jgi:hypothetical protein